MKREIKSILLSLISLKQYLKFVEKRFGKFVLGQNHIDINIFFTLLSKNRKPVQFIQIGANDGVKNDPIHFYIKKFHWKGILVEPLPQLFKKLVENYKEEENLIFENVGISSKSGEMDFYYLPSQYNEPDWLQQIGSFDLDAIKYNLGNYTVFLDKIETSKVSTVSLSELVERSGFLKVDLLIVDAEGFEYNILSQIENLKGKPTYILFEWGCMKEDIQRLLFDFLEKQLYKLYASGGDIMAVYNPKI